MISFVFIVATLVLGNTFLEGKEIADLTKEDLEIIQNIEILEDLEMLESIDLLEDYETIKEMQGLESQEETDEEDNG